MKVCHIVPTKWLPLVAHYDRHLVLAHQCLLDSTYQAFYAGQSAQGKHIILDNGAHELRYSLEVEKLIDVALIVRPACVVVPDVPRNRQASALLRNASLKKLRQFLGDDMQYMFVPQGANIEEWTADLKDILSLAFQVGSKLKFSLGFNPSLCDYLPSRTYALDIYCEIKDHLPVNYDIPSEIHLLGMEKNYAALLYMPARYRSIVTSMDTAHCAKLVQLRPHPVILSESVSRPKDFFSWSLPFSINEFERATETLVEVANGAYLRKLLA